MSNQNLIIYELDELYKILSEIKKDININFEKASKNSPRPVPMSRIDMLLEQQ